MARAKVRGCVWSVQEQRAKHWLVRNNVDLSKDVDLLEDWLVKTFCWEHVIFVTFSVLFCLQHKLEAVCRPATIWHTVWEAQATSVFLLHNECADVSVQTGVSRWAAPQWSLTQFFQKLPPAVQTSSLKSIQEFIFGLKTSSWRFRATIFFCLS